MPKQENKIFEKFQSQGLKSIVMFQLVLQVIVIERAHSCHQICNTELSMMLHNLTRDPCLMDIMIVIIIMTGAQFHRLIDMPGTGYIYTYVLVMDLVPET